MEEARLAPRIVRRARVVDVDRAALEGVDALRAVDLLVVQALGQVVVSRARSLEQRDQRLEGGLDGFLAPRKGLSIFNTFDALKRNIWFHNFSVAPRRGTINA